MGATVYLYKVFDTQEDKLLLNEVPLSEVYGLLGVNKGHILRCADAGHLIGKRYRISREIPTGKRFKKVSNSDCITLDLMSQWDDVHNAAEALKNGTGRIVKRRHGQRYVKYVEVK